MRPASPAARTSAVVADCRGDRRDPRGVDRLAQPGGRAGVRGGDGAGVDRSHRQRSGAQALGLRPRPVAEAEPPAPVGFAGGNQLLEPLRLAQHVEPLEQPRQRAGAKLERAVHQLVLARDEPRAVLPRGAVLAAPLWLAAALTATGSARVLPGQRPFSLRTRAELAAGAAHELGTPLSTLSVILGDWKHLPNFTSDPELLQDVVEMQAQVLRCKAIVSGILLSAGEARGESSSQTTVRQFLDTLVQNWRATRSVDTFVYDNLLEGDSPMVADATLEQMVFNVLDNARDASPHWVRLQAQCDADALRIVVTDRGPGFSAAVLRHIGTPYQSTKGRPGGGLGLFLSMNVARTLGGSVVARNRPEGGAEVTITLSLAAITLQDTDSEDHGH